MKRFVLKLLLVLLSLSCFQDVFAGPAHSTQRDKSRRRGANPCDVRTWCGRNAMPDSDDEDEQPSQHDGSTDGQDDGQTPRDNFPPETPTPDHSTGKPDKKKNRDESLVDHDEGENGSDEETFYKFINVEKPGNNYALIQGKLKVEVPFPNILMYCAPHSQDSNVAYVCIDYCGTGAMKMTLYNINDGSVIKTRTATREERPIIPLTTSMAQQIEALEQWCKDNEPTLDTTNPLDTGSVHETTPIVAPMLQDNVTGTHDDDDEQEGEGEDDDTSTASHGSPTDVDFSKIKHQTAPVNDDFEVVTHALSYDVIQSEDGDNAVLIHCAESEALYSIGHAKVLCCETFKENFEHIFLVARDYNGQVTIYILKKKGLTTVESKTFTPEEIQTLHIDADSDDYQVIWKYYKNKTISITRVSAQPDLTLEKLDEDEHTKHDNEDDVVFPSSGVVLEHTDDASSETTEQERFITQFVQKHSTAIQEGEKIERVYLEDKQAIIIIIAENDRRVARLYDTASKTIVNTIDYPHETEQQHQDSNTSLIDALQLSPSTQKICNEDPTIQYTDMVAPVGTQHDNEDPTVAQLTEEMQDLTVSSNYEGDTDFFLTHFADLLHQDDEVLSVQTNEDGHYIALIKTFDGKTVTRIYDAKTTTCIREINMKHEHVYRPVSTTPPSPNTTGNGGSGSPQHAPIVAPTISSALPVVHSEQDGEDQDVAKLAEDMKDLTVSSEQPREYGKETQEETVKLYDVYTLDEEEAQEASERSGDKYHPGTYVTILQRLEEFISDDLFVICFRETNNENHVTLVTQDAQGNFTYKTFDVSTIDEDTKPKVVEKIIISQQQQTLPPTSADNEAFYMHMRTIYLQHLEEQQRTHVVGEIMADDDQDDAPYAHIEAPTLQPKQVVVVSTEQLGEDAEQDGEVIKLAEDLQKIHVSDDNEQKGEDNDYLYEVLEIDEDEAVEDIEAGRHVVLDNEVTVFIGDDKFVACFREPEQEGHITLITNDNEGNVTYQTFDMYNTTKDNPKPCDKFIIVRELFETLQNEVTCSSEIELFCTIRQRCKDKAPQKPSIVDESALTNEDLSEQDESDKSSECEMGELSPDHFAWGEQQKTPGVSPHCMHNDDEDSQPDASDNNEEPLEIKWIKKKKSSVQVLQGDAHVKSIFLGVNVVCKPVLNRQYDCIAVAKKENPKSPVKIKIYDARTGRVIAQQTTLQCHVKTLTWADPTSVRCTGNKKSITIKFNIAQ